MESGDVVMLGGKKHLEWVWCVLSGVVWCGKSAWRLQEVEEK